MAVSVETISYDLRNISATLEKLGLELQNQTANQEDRLPEVFGQFYGGARKEVDNISQLLNATTTMYRDLENYFGEETNMNTKSSPFHLLTILSSFLVAFEVKHIS